MTDATTNTPEPENTADEKGDFRSQLTPEGRAALDALAPELTEKFISDESLLTVPDEEEEIEPVVVDEVVFVHPAVRDEPKGFLARAKQAVSTVVSDPKGALEDFKAQVPEKLEKIDENITKLEDRLESEQTVIETDAKAAAELELVLNTLKSQLTDKSALGDTITNMEKKLKYHKARVAVRTGVVGTLRKAIQGQHALRTQFAKITSK